MIQIISPQSKTVGQKISFNKGQMIRNPLNEKIAEQLITNFDSVGCLTISKLR